MLINNTTVSCPDALVLQYQTLGLTDKELILLLQLQNNTQQAVADAMDYTTTAPITNMLKSMEDKGLIVVERGQKINVSNLMNMLVVKPNAPVAPKKPKKTKKASVSYQVTHLLQKAGFYPTMRNHALASVVDGLIKEGYEPIGVLAAGLTGQQLQVTHLAQNMKPEEVLRGVFALAMLIDNYADIFNYVKWAYDINASWTKSRNMMVTRPRLAKLTQPENVQRWFELGKPVEHENGATTKGKDFGNI